MLRFENVIRLAEQLSPDTYWSAVDAQSGFRMVRAHPTCWHLNTYLWRKVWFVD
jgi:hypothetical protein